MQRRLEKTNDGSHTLYVEELDETYHSSHGAIQEAKHVFINNGVNQVSSSPVRVFEVGFGTGLNALLSLQSAIGNNKVIQYLGIEAYPVSGELVGSLNYVEMIDVNLEKLFLEMHECEWNEQVSLVENFTFHKLHSKIEEYDLIENYFDIIYFDAFGPRAQNEMWSITILEKMFHGLKEGGMLVTYCAQGQFKRNLRSIGFEVQSLPGPPGKREMTRAVKR